MPEREELIDAIVEDVQREVRRSIGERASTTDILRDVLRRRLSPPAAAQEIERLRTAIDEAYVDLSLLADRLRGSDEIDAYRIREALDRALTQEVERLRAELEQIAAPGCYNDDGRPGTCEECEACIARRALTQEDRNGR